MSQKTIVQKGEVWTLLGDKYLDFAAFLNDTTDTDAQNLRVIWDSVDSIDLEKDVFQTILALLLTKGTITQTEIDNVTAKIAELNAPKSF